MKKLKDHNYNGIDATIIADSKNEFGNRAITFVITFPRIVLAEFNTHRMLSRNSASSRAVPFVKMLQKTLDHPMVPIKWMKDHKGMQGNEFFTDKEIDDLGLDLIWLSARDSMISHAKDLADAGVTKQICNRLLEPFMWHTAIVTATEWENFFALRADEAAEIHIADLAHKMLAEANLSEPKQLKSGEWHIPFGDDIDNKRLGIFQNIGDDEGALTPSTERLKIKIATARCARVSYLNFEGKDDYEADIKLHDKLCHPDYGHWSPFEHCMKAMREEVYEGGLSDVKWAGGDEYGNPQYEYGWCGNVRGFVQYRKMFENENKKDSRFLLK
jgi:thymidylate synthase ThyX